MKNITIGIMTRFTELTGGLHNDFYNAIGGRMYDTMAPPEAATPYAVYNIVASNQEWEFVERFQNILLQITIVDDSSSGGTIKDTGSSCKTLYENCALTITGKTLVFMRWESEVLFKDDDGSWVMPIDFRLYVKTP